MHRLELHLHCMRPMLLLACRQSIPAHEPPCRCQTQQRHQQGTIWSCTCSTQVSCAAARYETKLSAERDIGLRLKGENGIMKKKFNALQKDIEDQRDEIKTLFEHKKELYQVGLEWTRLSACRVLPQHELRAEGLPGSVRSLCLGRSSWQGKLCHCAG